MAPFEPHGPISVQESAPPIKPKHDTGIRISYLGPCILGHFPKALPQYCAARPYRQIAPIRLSANFVWANWKNGEAPKDPPRIAVEPSQTHSFHPDSQNET